LAGKHALGARARKLNTTGALIVRFEMPFAIWCTNCKPHPIIIGQGVRFNAEKKKVGNYYSTPIYSFRMKHTVCGETIEIKTDPQNTAYVVTEGGRKRDTGEDKPLQPGEIAIKPHGLGQDPAEKDPFSKIEGKMEDKSRAKTEASRILEIQKAQKRDWEDPYEKSMKLRRTFRQERKGLEKTAAANEALKEKMSLGIEIVEETDMDRQRASMVDFGEDHTAFVSRAERANLIKPMFERADTSRKLDAHGKCRSSRRTKPADPVLSRKAAFRKELVANTRATMDPFLKDVADGPDAWKLKMKKKSPVPSTPFRRLSANNSTATASRATKPDTVSTNTPTVSAKKPLVEYPSDSE
jgi:coiled-coil domain-containing protein 130